MKPCSDKLMEEQARLFEEYLLSDYEDPYKYAYEHGSDELRDHFDAKEKQNEEDRRNHKVTN